MGAVYVAEHPHLGRRVAIKVLHPGVDRNPEVVYRFFTEAKAATEIRNEHIVEVLDFGELAPDGVPYLVMEWLEGESLGEALRKAPRQSVQRTASVVRGIAQALKAAHAKGVIHRDLKPDNVFLLRRDGAEDFVKVLDFGIAKLIQASDSNRYQTQTGAIIGTPAYMSPEQCRGAKHIDTRTDVYSLGVIAYQMLTGRLPFAADALGELLFKHLSETPVPPAAVHADIPPAVSDVVARTLEKDPDKRPSLDELAAALDPDAAARVSGPASALLSSRSAVAPSALAATGGSLAGGTLVAPVATTPPGAGTQTTLRSTASELGVDERAHGAGTTGQGRSRAFVIAGAAVVVWAPWSACWRPADERARPTPDRRPSRRLRRYPPRDRRRRTSRSAPIRRRLICRSTASRWPIRWWPSGLPTGRCIGWWPPYRALARSSSLCRSIGIARWC